MREPLARERILRDDLQVDPRAAVAHDELDRRSVRRDLEGLGLDRDRVAGARRDEVAPGGHVLEAEAADAVLRRTAPGDALRLAEERPRLVDESDEEDAVVGAGLARDHRRFFYFTQDPAAGDQELV